MLRETALQAIETQTQWDIIIIGGGATGLGIAVDAASRGFSTLLLEKVDFAKGTSSRSTKLVHGGVRYLAQGDVSLVKEALRERGRLAQNAPHVFKTQSFVIAGEKCWTAPFYGFGLWLYDRLAGKLSIGRTQYLDKHSARAHLPGVKHEKIHNGVRYYDGQFDDARLAITLAQTACDYGATLINHCAVVGINKSDGKITGVVCEDELSGARYLANAKVVINATGVFTNDIMRLDAADNTAAMLPSQGIHLVFDRAFMPSDDALMIPRTSDGRVLFAVPWHDKLVVGTTDTVVDAPSFEPVALEEEIRFILETLAQYLDNPPTRADVKSIFAGLRPLALPKADKSSNQASKSVSRSHHIEISASGLVTILGGKWTTYRQMAEDVLEQTISAFDLEKRPCQTQSLRLHGYLENTCLNQTVFAPYGSDAPALESMMQSQSQLATRIHPDYPYVWAQVAWAIEQEMAQTLEDVLARRIRLLFLDAKAAREVAPAVAQFMAEKLGWDEAQQAEKLAEFLSVSQGYCIDFL